MNERKAGQTVPFGSFIWRVPDIKDNAALLITEEMIAQRTYHDVYKDITWADCSLRKYLNSEFNDRFSPCDTGQNHSGPE